MALRDDALEFHRKSRGKIAIKSKVPCSTREDLSLAYTPGVAEPCREIENDPVRIYDYTAKGNLVAVVTDGSAVLGLGDIGPAAAMPVMEGKAILFKEFADVDAFPICIDSSDPAEIVEVTKRIATVFGGINLEDISAPRCFEIEERLKRDLDIPVFHDDQHGTAVVTGAALINALKIAKKGFEDVSVVMSGAGAAGVAVSKFLMSLGVRDIVLCDSKGVIHSGRSDLNSSKAEMARITNPKGKAGTLADAMAGADVRIRGDGQVDGQRSHSLRHGKPRPRDHARPREEGGGEGRGHRQVRLPQPGEQRPGLSRDLPGGPGRPGAGDQRGDEDGGGEGDRNARGADLRG